jgi:cell wall-associated NlpC family hydrolase
VSAALSACGLTCPADSDQQEAALGETVSDGTYLPGDLLFWCGHVAMVRDPQTLIHANAHHMAVAYEPITDAIARIKAQGDGEPTRHARLT